MRTTINRFKAAQGNLGAEAQSGRGIHRWEHGGGASLPFQPEENQGSFCRKFLQKGRCEVKSNERFGVSPTYNGPGGRKAGGGFKEGKWHILAGASI